MTQNRENRFEQWVSSLCEGCTRLFPRVLPPALSLFSLYYVLQYLAIALLRLSYPYELEWLEGACVTHSLRLLDGKGMYVPPSVDFVPFLYPSLFFDLGAAFIGIFGRELFSLRLLSFLASIGLFGVLFVWARRESGQARAGLWAIGLFAATFQWAGAWLDLARVDALFLFFLTSGAMLLRFHRGVGTDAGAALFFVLAFMTKQTATPVALACGLCTLLTRQGWARLVFPAVFALGFLSYWGIQHWQSDGWFTHYVFTMPRRYGLMLDGFFRFWTSDLLPNVPLFLVAGVTWLFLPEQTRDWRRFLFTACLLAAFLAITWLSRMHYGGYANVLLPLAFLGALAGGIVLAKQPSSFVYLAFLVQFFLLLYNPKACVPTAEDREAGDQVVHYIRSVEGSVYVPHHSLLPLQAGKADYHTHTTPFFDLALGTPGDEIDQLMVDALAEQRWDVIILSGSFFPQYLARWYQQVDPPFPVNEHLTTRTGVPMRPRYVYVKRDAANDPTVGQPLR